jgi:hypothetical protein
MTIEVLPTGGHTKYLGRKLCFKDSHRVEIENRISAAWKKFFTLKQELLGKRYCLSDRFRLFHGTVTPTILYGCEAWTLTGELENRLKRTQRQILRMILHLPRHTTTNTTDDRPQNTATQPTNETEQPPQPHEESTDSGSDVDSNAPTPMIPPADDINVPEQIEPWSDWIKRCTHEAEARMTSLRLDDWTTLQRRRKWRWLHKLATTTHQTWTTAAIRWDPTQGWKQNATRRVGRPRTRWLDDICAHLDLTYDDHNHSWDIDALIKIAQDTHKWATLEKDYVTKSGPPTTPTNQEYKQHSD